MYLGRDEELHSGGMVPDKPSYVSRFALKFAEILGAGLATALSGYLVAHLGGYLPWPNKAPAPTAAVEALPSGGSKTAVHPRTRAALGSAEDDIHAAAAHDDHGKEPAPGKAVEISAPATAAAAPPVDDEKHSRGASASHKAVSEARAAKPAPRETAKAKAHEEEAKAHETAEAKAREEEAKTHETAEAKAREEEAVEEQVRAALANVDASRPQPAAPLMPPLAASPMPQTPAIPQPQPLIAPTNPGVTATAPGPASTTPTVAVPRAVPPQPLDTQKAAAVGPMAPSASVAAPIRQSPAEPSPLSTVEIKSLPVAGVAETSSAAPASAQTDDQPDGKTKETNKGFFSAITHLPDMLRADAPDSGNEPPRPPLPVGQ